MADPLASSLPRVLALHVGRVETHPGHGATGPLAGPWTTGIFKTRVDAPCRLGPLGFDGDQQADLVDHGGPDKAACLYPARHYPEWRAQLALAEFPFGAFGENLTVDGLDEHGVCIGDIWRVGDAVVQVSQPRQPCWKLGRRWRLPDLPDRVVKSGYTGWYVRVLTAGLVETGDPWALQERPHAAWTIAAANSVMHQRAGDLAALAGLAALSASWRSTLARRLAAARRG